MNETPSHEIKLNDLMFLALDHAVESVRESADLLIPFSITESDDKGRTLTRFADERVEQGVEHGKKFIEDKKSDLDRYALAWDGFITIEEKKWDAMFVEAGDKVADTATLICQRYQKKKGLFKKGIEPVGNAALVGNPITYQMRPNKTLQLTPSRDAPALFRPTGLYPRSICACGHVRGS